MAGGAGVPEGLSGSDSRPRAGRGAVGTLMPWPTNRLYWERTWDSRRIGRWGNESNHPERLGCWWNGLPWKGLQVNEAKGTAWGYFSWLWREPSCWTCLRQL